MVNVRFLTNLIGKFSLAAIVLLGTQTGFAQRAGWHGGMGQAAGASPQSSAGAPAMFGSGRSAASINSPGTGPAGGTGPSLGDPGFPSHLGATVGSYPGVALPPGVSNINHPGLQPLSTTVQPLPTGTTGGMGGATMPPRWGSTWDGRGNGRGDGRRGGLAPGSVPDAKRGPGKRSHARVVYYNMPYYVPYTIYTFQTATAAAQPTQTAPYGSGYTSVQPGQAGAASSPSRDAAAKPLTVLVFKDRTVVMVRSYWLEGDRLWYETAEGVRASIFLEQLDLPFTQQLNRERNVRFVLESRP